MNPTTSFAGRFPRATVAMVAFLVSLLTACGHKTAVISATAPPVIGSADPAHPTKLPGIPFYVKRGMCKRETVWSEPRFTLQVDVQVGDKPVTSRSIVIPRSYMLGNEDSPSPDYLRTVLNDLGALSAARDVLDLGNDANHVCPDDLRAAWETLDADVKAKTQPTFCEEIPGGACENIAAAETDGNLLRLVNNASVVTEVDYEHVYYMNTQTPWIGNASVDAKLQADGTLNEGNLQANDQTWSTILQTIGGLATNVATVEAAKYGAAATAASTTATTTATTPSSTGALESNMTAMKAMVNRLSTAETEPYCKPHSVPGWPLPKMASTDKKTTTLDSNPSPGAKSETTKTEDAISYRFSITPTVYLHDHVRKDLGIAAAALACVPEASGVTSGSFTITKADESKGKDDPNTIKVSGQVVLPKADSDKAPK